MAGRPTDYRPEYCDQLVEFCREGASLVEFAARVGVSRSTLYRWGDAHPTFRDAITRALAVAQAWWEKKCRENVDNKYFNAKLAEFQMVSRFRDDYAPQSARLEITHTGQVNIRSLPDSELERLAAQAVIDIEEVEPKRLAQGGQTSDPVTDTET